MKRTLFSVDSIPFIGRSRPLKQLYQIMQSALMGHVQTVFVQGEAGIGKTRLVQVAASEAEGENWLVLRGRSQSIGGGLAFAPAVEGLRMAIQGFEEKKKLQVREEFPYLNVFFPNLGGPMPVPLLNPAMERIRLFETLRLFLVHLASEQPLIFWLDDLPEADEDTLQWLQYCVQYTNNERIVFIATCRTSHEASNEMYLQLKENFLRHRLLHTIQLEQLATSDSLELIRTQLDGTIEESLLDSIHSRTIGIPLYILELIHTLIQSKQLQLKHGSWELMQEIDEIVPLQITSLFEHRMDQLSTSEQVLLTMLTVSDATIPWNILRTASELDSDTLAQSIHELIKENLIQEEQKDGELCYGFVHPMIKSIAYARVSSTILQHAHRKLADAWKHDDIARTAFHIIASGNPDDETTSARLLYEAGKRYLSIYSYQNAVEYLEQAERFIARRDDPETNDLHWEIRLALSETMAYMEQPEQALQLLEELYGQTEEAGTKIHLKRLMVWVETSRSHEHCLRHIVEGIAEWDGCSENDDILWMLNERVFNDLNYGNLAEAEKSYMAMKAYAKNFPSNRTSFLCLIREAHLAMMNWKIPSSILEKVDHMLEETHTLNEPELTYDLYCLTGYAALNQGDYTTALQYAKKGTHLVRKNGMVIYEISVRLVGMSALFQQGNWERALEEAEAVEHLARNYGIHSAVLCTLDLKSLIYGLRGKTEESVGFLQESLRLSRYVFPKSGLSSDVRSKHVVEAVTEIMKRTDSPSPRVIGEPIVVYWFNTHGLQPFLKLMEGLWLLKHGLENALLVLLDQFEVDEIIQEQYYVSGIRDLLAGLLMLQRDEVFNAKDKLVQAINTFEKLSHPLEFAIARAVWSSVADPEQANVAKQKSIKELHRLGAHLCIDWLENSFFSQSKRKTNFVPKGLLDPLTTREEEILHALALGLSNKEIAASFDVKEGTVKTHLFNLYTKLGVKRRTQAVAKAQELRLMK